MNARPVMGSVMWPLTYDRGDIVRFTHRGDVMLGVVKRTGPYDDYLAIKTRLGLHRIRHTAIAEVVRHAGKPR